MICNRICQSVKLWRNADAVCFDFDSTLTKDEFIDQMADFVGKGPEVSAVTHLAMAGALPFEDALDARLKAINITKETLDKLVDSKPYRISEGAEELVAALQARNVDVYIVSGSFIEAIIPVADQLLIPEERVFSNGLIFDANGNYAGFDRDRPTARKGGKRTIVEMLKKAHNYKCLAFIGDGATDLETYDPPHATDLFVGFGILSTKVHIQRDMYMSGQGLMNCGNVSRELIRKNAPIFVESFSQLTEWLAPENDMDCNCCNSEGATTCKPLSKGNNVTSAPCASNGTFLSG